MKIAKEVREGNMIPAWYGVAWVRLDADASICYPMPLNLIVAAARAVVIWMRWGYRAVPRDVRNAYAQGVRDGKRSRAEVMTIEQLGTAQLSITLAKLYSGTGPGDEMWSDLDYEAVEFAVGHAVERKKAAVENPIPQPDPQIRDKRPPQDRPRHRPHSR